MIIVRLPMKRLLTLFSTWCYLTVWASGPKFMVDAARSAGAVSPKLDGLMTEEINHSSDGGLYAELIRNRVFLDKDWFDHSESYDQRFAQFHKAMKARYPQLKTISTIGNEQPKNCA